MNSTADATTTPANGSPAPKSDTPEVSINETADDSGEQLSTSQTAVPAISDTVKWPGWPGYVVFRLIVPVLKVGSIIGRKGEFMKKMCEETQARIRVLDGPVGAPDRVVLIHGKEDPDAPLSAAMLAVMQVFRRVSGLVETEGEAEVSGAAGAAYCSIRLLVAGTQAIHLNGKQGSTIKSIQESSGASVRVLAENEVSLFASSDERVVEVQGEALKVLKALELIIGYLRKFLVDHTILPLFLKNYNTPAQQDHTIETWGDKILPHTSSQAGISSIGSDYLLSARRESLFLDRDSQLDSHIQASRFPHYGQEMGLSGLRAPGISRTGAAIVTQVAQTMQIPLSYAEAIIGIGGANIAYIRRTSGAILTVQESRGLPEEITVEIKGTSAQVQAAQQLIQDFISNQKDPLQSRYGIDSNLRSAYSQVGNYGSSLPTQPYGGGGGGGMGYGSPGSGGYNNFRL